MAEVKFDTYYDEPEGIYTIVPIGKFTVVEYNDGVTDVLVEEYDPVEDKSESVIVFSVAWGEAKNFTEVARQPYDYAIKESRDAYTRADELKNDANTYSQDW